MTSDVRVEETPVGPVVRPPGPARVVLLYLHGDWPLRGDPEPALGLAGRLALRTGAAVVCCRYRPGFPAALRDARDGLRYCQAAGPVVVAGSRLGAGLAAALLIAERDAGAALPRAAVLISALLDAGLQAPSLQLNAAADPTFDVAGLRRRVAGYAAGTALTDPLLSPLHANLDGLPPVQLLAAGNDVLLDDSLAFAARAARSGVTVDLRVQPDAARLRETAVTAVAEFIGAGRAAPEAAAVPLGA